MRRSSGRRAILGVVATMVALLLLALSSTSAGAVGAGLPLGVKTTVAPSLGGSWAIVGSSPVLSIHATVLRNGSVLLIEGSGFDPNRFAAGTFKTSVWNPATGQFADVPTPADFFCSGHMALPSGNVLLGGGTAGYPLAGGPWLGLAVSYVFDPTTNSYQRVGDMADGHWYPTLVKLGDGRPMAFGGLDGAGNGSLATERYDPATKTWSSLPNRDRYWGLYPNMVLMQDGRLFYSGVSTYPNAAAPSIYNWQTNNAATVPGLTNPGRDQGATILLPPAQSQKVMVMGGAAYASGRAVADTNIIDLSAASPRYTWAPPLPTAKMYVNAVILPDSTVFETGGGQSNVTSAATNAASVYDPRWNAFSPMNSPTVARLYHSEAFLLPDGRVATLGSNPLYEGFEMRIEVFSPPYLFKGARPSITGGPTEIKYGGSYAFTTATPSGKPITSMNLIHPASVTHQSDPNQRLVNLPITAIPGAALAAVPANPNLAPPGWYMAFAVDSAGVPSVARWVHLT